jgi:glycosyltransferase involved in cell wall biosynthesis
MHVGVIAPDWTAQAGGAYTLENDLFDVLFTEGLSTRHRFTALVNSAAKPGRSTYPTLTLPKAGIAKRVFRKGHRILRSVAQRMGVVKPSNSVPWLADLLAKNRIEFLISLNPFKVLTPQPYLVYVWDLEHRKQPFFPEVRGEDWQFREKHYYHVLGQAAFVITGTRAGAAEVERFFGVHPKRIRVIPFPTPQYALEASGADEIEEPLPQLPAGAPFLFYPSQFWAHKNHVTALKVIRELRVQHQLSVKLVLAGSDQGNWPHVEQWIRRLQLENDVIYAGFVSRPQMRWLYRNALALLYASLFGPDNLPPLEAFALGCPVIASAIDGASEQLGDAAVLCNPMDVGSYANASASLLRDPSLRADLIKRGKARAARWTRRDAVKSLVEILDEFAEVRDNWGD